MLNTETTAPVRAKKATPRAKPAATSKTAKRAKAPEPLHYRLWKEATAHLTAAQLRSNADSTIGDRGRVAAVVAGIPWTGPRADIEIVLAIDADKREDLMEGRGSDIAIDLAGALLDRAFTHPAEHAEDVVERLEVLALRYGVVNANGTTNDDQPDGTYGRLIEDARQIAAGSLPPRCPSMRLRYDLVQALRVTKDAWARHDAAPEDRSADLWAEASACSDVVHGVISKIVDAPVRTIEDLRTAAIALSYFDPYNAVEREPHGDEEWLAGSIIEFLAGDNAYRNLPTGGSR